MALGLEPERVEDVELDLRTPERRRRDAALREVALGLAGHIARIPAVGLAAPRLDDVARQDQGRDLERRVDIGRRRVGHEQHVRLVDVLETTDARAIEADAVDEQVFAKILDRDAEMLGLSGQVHETQVDDQDAGLSGERQYVGDGRGGCCDTAWDPLERGHRDRYPPSACATRTKTGSCTSGGHGIRGPGCGSVPVRVEFLVHFA